MTIVGHVLGLVMILAAEDGPPTPSQSSSPNGYCGFLAAIACARDFGLDLDNGAQGVKRLRELEIASFADIQVALQESGLVAEGYRITRQNAAKMGNRLSLGKTLGIARVAAGEGRMDAGHFLVATNIADSGVVYGYDPSSHQVLGIPLTERSVVPLLLVSTPSGRAMQNSLESIGSSPLLTPLLAVILIVLLLGLRTVNWIFMIGLTSRLGVLCCILCASVAFLSRGGFHFSRKEFLAMGCSRSIGG
jgi:hypothetical protein